MCLLYNLHSPDQLFNKRVVRVKSTHGEILCIIKTSRSSPDLISNQGVPREVFIEIPLSEANAGQSKSDIPYKAVPFPQALGVQFPAAAEKKSNFMKNLQMDKVCRSPIALRIIHWKIFPVGADHVFMPHKQTSDFTGKNLSPSQRLKYTKRRTPERHALLPG